MSIDDLKIVGLTDSEKGKIVINNKKEFIENFALSYDTQNINSDLQIDFKKEAFNKLHNDEWFYIDLSEEEKISIENKITETRTLLDLSKKSKLKYVIYYILEDGDINRVNIEYLTNKNIGTTHILKSVNGKKFKYEAPNSKNFEITGNVQIKYYKDVSKLYFKKHTDIKGIFDIIQAFNEASNSEINDFKDYDIISFTKDFPIGIRNKKKIKMILDKKVAYLNDSSKKATLMSYAQKYNIGIFNKNGKADVSNNGHLSDLVDLLLENFNEDPISKEKVRIQAKKSYTK